MAKTPTACKPSIRARVTSSSHRHAGENWFSSVEYSESTPPATAERVNSPSFIAFSSCSASLTLVRVDVGVPRSNDEGRSSSRIEDIRRGGRREPSPMYTRRSFPRLALLSGDAGWRDRKSVV